MPFKLRSNQRRNRVKLNVKLMKVHNYYFTTLAKLQKYKLYRATYK